MSVHRLRRWPNINLTLSPCLSPRQTDRHTSAKLKQCSSSTTSEEYSHLTQVIINPYHNNNYVTVNLICLGCFGCKGGL